MRKILNYQGGKTNLLPDLKNAISRNIVEGKAFLDIFAGSCVVSQEFFDKAIVYTNDLEKYSYVIASSFIDSWKYCKPSDEDIDILKGLYAENKNKLFSLLQFYITQEEVFFNEKDIEKIKILYSELPQIWNTKNLDSINRPLSPDVLRTLNCDCLFSGYYSGSYFGIAQAIDIDSIHYAILKHPNEKLNKNAFLAILFSCLNSCVFSKDGHMAQPLSLEKNVTRLWNKRSINIFESFCELVKEEQNTDYNFNENIRRKSMAFNKDFVSLLNDKNVMEQVGCIYADPPYTDMQYSRYYHLLNTLVEYDYPYPTKKNGGYTSGLYLNNRNQSELSQHSHCLGLMRLLLEKCKFYNINLIISFAYPVDRKIQKTDRYLMSIDDLVDSCNLIYGANNIVITTHDYKHSNHRNHEQKTVLEYIIECKGNKI